MRARISNLSSLVDFECAARWQSIKLAAKELNKTPSAVSQQIKLLEQQLGFELFKRQTRQINLTKKGIEFAATARHLLHGLDRKILELQDSTASNNLNVSCIHSFAMKWLVARLPNYAKIQPQIAVHILSSHRLADLDDEKTDIAIRYAPLSSYPHDKLLRQEQLIAVYSPSLTDKQLATSDIAQFPLLYENSRATWIRWMQLNACVGDRHSFGQNFSQSGLLVQAAVSGNGIALAPETIAFDDLEAGNLLRVKGTNLPSEYGYFFLSSSQTAELSKTLDFRKWLELELHAFSNR